MATIREDNERRYTGTNFAVAALITLLMLVGGYFLVAQISDVADDDTLVSSTDADVNAALSPASGEY